MLCSENNRELKFFLYLDKGYFTIPIQLRYLWFPGIFFLLVNMQIKESKFFIVSYCIKIKIKMNDEIVYI